MLDLQSMQRLHTAPLPLAATAAAGQRCRRRSLCATLADSPVGLGSSSLGSSVIVCGSHRQQQMPTCSFMGTLPPAALVPDFLAWGAGEPEGAGGQEPSPSAKRRSRLRQRMHDALSACRTQRPLRLPDPEPQEAAPEQAVSNAVPFSPAEQRGSSGGSPTPSSAAPPPRAECVRRVLPWLWVAPGALDLRSVETLASETRLTGLATVDLSRLRSCWPPPGVHWPGGAPPLSAATCTAAVLRRLAVRQGLLSGDGLANDGPARGHAAVLLQHAPEQAGLAAEVLGLFLHLYCGLAAEEAAEVRPGALRCRRCCRQATAAGWTRAQARLPSSPRRRLRTPFPAAAPRQYLHCIRRLSCLLLRCRAGASAWSWPGCMGPHTSMLVRCAGNAGSFAVM